MKRLALALFVLSLAACRYDPVAQKAIDALPPDDAPPSATHRPGQPCLACHASYEGSKPVFAVAGTVFTQDKTGALVPAARVRVAIQDSTADVPKTPCTNAAGNFFVKKDDWPDAAFPLKVVAGDRAMHSLVGRDGSCASCHKLPSTTSLDPKTGAGRDSPGVVLVGDAAMDMSCP